MTSPQPLAFMFKDDGKVPNNPALPALIYKAAVDFGGNDPARAIESLFAQNGWGHGQWRNGIYPFVHYHAMIHEVLGIARGTARVQLGGPSGETFDFAAGDVAVLPAGTTAVLRLRRAGDPAAPRARLDSLVRSGWAVPITSAQVQIPRGSASGPCIRAGARLTVVLGEDVTILRS